MVSSYFDRQDRPAQKSELDKLVDGALAMAWICVVGTVTYFALLFTDILPEEMRLAAVDQLMNPGAEAVEEPEDVVKIAGLDPESLAMLAMAATTMGETKIGLAATDLLEEYDEDAFALMQEMELAEGDADYVAMLQQLPDDVVDTTMTEDEAMAALLAQSAAMAEMQTTLEEAGTYDGPIDGLDNTGDFESVIENANAAALDGVGGEGGSATMGETVAMSLTEAGYLDEETMSVKAMTDQALETILDEQRYTVPMLDTGTNNIEKIRDYRDLLRDPDTMLSGETDASVRFVRSYMLPHTLLTDAIAYREAGDTDRALNALRLIFLAFPAHPMTGDALLLLSDIQDHTGETEASRRTLTTFLSVHGGHARIADGVIRYGDWTIASGDGLPAACKWLDRVSVYPPAIDTRALKAIAKAAQLRGCHASPMGSEIAAL